MTSLASCARRTALLTLVLVLAGCSGSAGARPATVSSSRPIATAPAAASAMPASAVARSGATKAPRPTPTATPSDVAVRPGEAWLVYQGGTGGPARIRLVRPDGTGDHVVVAHVPHASLDGWQQHPDWSHDGRRIAFSADMTEGGQDLWVVNADGTGARKLYDCQAPCGWSDQPAWSPDDRTIAFVSADHVGEVDSVAYVDTIDVQTGEHRRILQAPKLAWCYVPRWAPDGHRLVIECDIFKTARFDEDEVTARTVGIVDTTASKPAFRPLLPWGSWAEYPDWHPTDDRIVLQVPTDREQPLDEADIAVLDASRRSDLRVLTAFGPRGGWAIQPSWTPDGQAITFVAEDVVRTHPNVATIAADGSALRRLTDDVRRTHPRLRPVP